MTNLATRDRRANEVKILEVRSLTTADLHLLRNKNAIPQFTLTRGLRDRHHHIAWLLALGKSHVEIGVECRMSPERIHILAQAPAMVDLISRYRKELEDARISALREFGEKAAHNMAMAEEILTSELSAVLAGTRETPALRDLNRIATDRMDRFGYGKTSTVNVNTDFARKLEAAIARADSARHPKVIEHE